MGYRVYITNTKKTLRPKRRKTKGRDTKGTLRHRSLPKSHSLQLSDKGPLQRRATVLLTPIPLVLQLLLTKIITAGTSRSPTRVRRRRQRFRVVGVVVMAGQEVGVRVPVGGGRLRFDIRPRRLLLMLMRKRRSSLVSGAADTEGFRVRVL